MLNTVVLFNNGIRYSPSVRSSTAQNGGPKTGANHQARNSPMRGHLLWPKPDS